MNHPSQRSYRSAKRAEGADATKRRILDAARALFAEHGYATTALADIAQRAGVSVQTIYLAFGSKKALPIALLGDIERQAGQDELPRKLSEAASPEAQVDIYAAFTTRLFTKGAEVIALARDAAATEPDMAELVRMGDTRRLEGVRYLVRPWHAAGILKPGLSPATAADIVWALSDPGTHHLLVKQRRWSNARYRAWLAQLIRDQLFTRPATE